jgi:hypothetical protein
MKILKHILLKNIAIKSVALILALLTWGYIVDQLYRGDDSGEREASSVIKVSGQKLIVRRLPIYVNIEGEPLEGYRVLLDKITINPSHSVVAGAPDVISDISYLTTKPVIVQGKNSTIRDSLSLAPIANCKIGYEGLVRVTVPIVRDRRR